VFARARIASVLSQGSHVRPWDRACVPHDDAEVALLANRAYWLMHHDVTGAPLTSSRAASRVIAAAMLGELIGQESIAVEARQVQLFTPAPRLDALGVSVRDQIADEQIAGGPGLGPTDVIDGLAASIRQRVADRLVAVGAAERRRVGLFRRVAVARPGDLKPAAVRTDLADRITRGVPLDADERFLLRLLQHSSMSANPLTDIDPSLVRRALQPNGAYTDQYAELLAAAVAVLRATAPTR
jgi:hypothetical protein